MRCGWSMGYLSIETPLGFFLLSTGTLIVSISLVTKKRTMQLYITRFPQIQKYGIIHFFSSASKKTEWVPILKGEHPSSTHQHTYPTGPLWPRNHRDVREQPKITRVIFARLLSQPHCVWMRSSSSFLGFGARHRIHKSVAILLIETILHQFDK